MNTGIIVALHDRKFGFNRRAGSDDLYFHTSALRGRYPAFENLHVGDGVRFELELANGRTRVGFVEP
jgi:cold shock CspA family protein